MTMARLEPAQFSQHVQYLQRVLQNPLDASPRQMMTALAPFQAAVGAPDPHLRSIEMYLKRLPWGEDICHQVCGGIRALLQLKAIQPNPQESDEQLYKRYQNVCAGEHYQYEVQQSLRKTP